MRISPNSVEAKSLFAAISNALYFPKETFTVFRFGMDPCIRFLENYTEI